MKKFFVELFTPILDVLKSICFFFDNIIYGFIPNLYKLMMYLANVNLTNNDTIKALTSRVYILVGIFMLFKLSFSILRYVIDPNSFTDQGKGIGNLVKRVLISLILLVSIPFIFDKAYDLQRIVIKSNIIPRMILGTDTGSDVTDSLDSSATDVQFLLFGPFFSVNYAIEDLAACEPSNDRPMANILGTADMARATKNIDGSTTECLTQFNDALLNSNLKNADVNLKDFFRYGANGTDERDFSQLGALISWSIDSQKVIIYQPVISTLVGVYLVFLLLSFCIDVAARAIRLSFYQMLSPVAVISYMDPSEGTQGGKLKEWATECLRVFVSIFLRLAVMFLIVQVVKIISEALSVSDGSLYYDETLAADAKSMNKYVYLFLVLGAFQAAGKLPEIIEKAFGFKLSGELNLNPFKSAGVGAFVGGAIGAGATSISSAATALSQGSGFLGTAKSALTGLGVGAVRGARGGYGKDLSGAAKAGTHSGGVAARNMLMRREQGISVRHPLSSLGKSVAMGFDRFLDQSGGPDLYQMRNAKVQRLNKFVESAKSLRSTVETNAGASKAIYRDENGNSLGSYRDYLRNLQAAEWRLEQQAREGDGKVAINVNGKSYSDYASAKAALDSARDDAYQSYMDSANSQSLITTDGTALRDFDVEAGLKDVVSSRSLLTGDLDIDPKADFTNLKTLKSTQIAASDMSKSIQSPDSFRDSKSRHETRANVSQERFYETGGK